MTAEQAMLEAASRMQAAAEKMTQAAKDIDFALGNHERFLKDWLSNFQLGLSELTELVGNADAEGFPVRIVGNSVEVEEDRHEAKTMPAPAPPADSGPLELEGSVS